MRRFWRLCPLWGPALPYLEVGALCHDVQQVEVDALQGFAAAQALENNGGGFAQELHVGVCLEEDADGGFRNCSVTALLAVG